MKTKSVKNKSIIFLAVASLLLLVMNSAKANQEIEDQIINFVNQERAKEGLEQLVENDLLNEVAKLKAQDMLGNDYFAHTSPAGLDPWYWFKKVGYSYKYAGENLGMDFETAVSVHNAWMKSTTHKENILSNKYKEIGVAVKRGIINNQETQIAVQVFGSSLADNSSLVPAEAKKEKVDIGKEEEIEVNITQSSIHFWQGGEEDEMLVSAEVQGNPKEVKVVIGTEEYLLEKLRDNVYVNLISLKGMSIRGENILIKALNEEEVAFFSKVPDKYFAEYLIEEENQKVEDRQVAMMLTSDQNDSDLLNKARLWFNQTGFMLLIVGLFVITIFNIWILEREEERLLELKT